MGYASTTSIGPGVCPSTAQRFDITSPNNAPFSGQITTNDYRFALFDSPKLGTH